jgi:predicted ester cyclase
MAPTASSRAPHEGDFMGIPATGRRISVPVVDIVRFRDGRAAEHWGATPAP